jgi:hypothetical protein
MLHVDPSDPEDRMLSPLKVNKWLSLTQCRVFVNHSELALAEIFGESMRHATA